MSMTAHKPLDEYLKLQYPFHVVADPDGGYVVTLPDLPGCMTQADAIDDIPAMVKSARALWIETAFDKGIDIPLPSYPADYSGKFVVRVPRSLHRRLAESAEDEGVSLNQYVASLLSRRDADAGVERKLEEIQDQIEGIYERLRFTVTGAPTIPSRQRELSNFSLKAVAA